MGLFVMGPVAEELRATAAAPGAGIASGAARRCLDVLVPLSYRPAIKACPAALPPCSA